MKPTTWRLNRDRRFYATGRDDQVTSDRPATQQFLRVGANLAGFVVVLHG
jgi:hypothetical protein